MLYFQDVFLCGALTACTGRLPPEGVSLVLRTLESRGTCSILCENCLEQYKAVQSSTTDVHPLFSSNTVHEHRPQCATFSKLHRVKSSFIFIAAPKIRLHVTWPLSVIVNSMWYLGRLDSPSSPIPR